MLSFSMRILMKIFLVILIALFFSCESASKSSNDPNDPMRFGVSLDSLSQLSHECVNRINDFRATENLDPLERWTEAEVCTHESAQSDSETNKAHGAFGSCDEWGQNECPGWNSLESTVDKCLESMWNEKDLGPDVPFSANGHYLNMTNLKYSKVACGFYQTPEGKVWAIQNFK